MPTITDGAYFELNGTTFSVVTMKGSAETRVSSGSFNGTLGLSYTPGTNAQTYEIYWTNNQVLFVAVVAGESHILHTVSSNSATWANTLNHHIFMDSVNSNGLQTANTLTCRGAAIRRLGKAQTAPTYKHISTSTTTICKYGLGTLHRICVNNPTNNTITIYDNTAGSGTVIAIIDPDNGATPFELNYDLPFNTGLTVVTAGTPDLTICFE